MIDSILIGDLLGRRAIGLHSPDLQLAGARRIEIDELAVRRVVRSVIQSIRGQPMLGTAVDWHGENVSFAGAALSECKALTVRSAGMKVTGRRGVGDPARCSTAQGR